MADLPMIRITSPEVLYLKGTTKYSVPRLCRGGTASTRWSGVNCTLTEAKRDPEDTNIGEEAWTRLPVKSPSNQVDST